MINIYVQPKKERKKKAKYKALKLKKRFIMVAKKKKSLQRKRAENTKQHTKSMKYLSKTNL